jgi:hypothetical protein
MGRQVDEGMVLLQSVFELAAVAYGPRIVPGTRAYTEVSKKRKVDASDKASSKHVKAPRKKKVELLKIVVP